LTRLPLLEQLAWRREAGVLQLVAVVAVDHTLRDSGEVEVAADRVASALRADAEGGATDFGFS
jgi:hypothetical protein